MAVSNFLPSSFLFATLVVALLCPMAAAQNSQIFTEYIGAQFNGVKFSDVPVNPGVQFNFILSFAIDYDGSTSPPSPTDGTFSIFWDSTTLTPAAIAAVKQSNPNVKVGLSLGGATVNTVPVVFTPTSIDSWVSNAVDSLTAIISEYGLDGVDVDYESFPSGDDADIFAECIGRLLTTLKSQGVISFASIAPFADPDVQRHYEALWAKYASVIDYVNFQFYAYDSSTTVAQFLDYYQQQAANYAGGKVIASFITASVSPGYGGLTPQNGFFDACTTLKNQGMLPGIFVWSADDSFKSSNGFQYEQQAQELLIN